MKKVISVLIVIIGVILLAFGVAAETAQNASLGIIGGADGPTVIMVAGSPGAALGVIIAGILLIVAGIWFFIRRKRKY